MRTIRKLAYLGVSLTAFSTPAFAQDAASKDEPSKDEIVVTGTLIRGTQATGSQTVTVDAKAITQIAATSTNELLTSIPQIQSFNGRPEGDPRGLTSVSSIVRPNLRSFPSTNSTSGALTLIMVDGLRLTPVGSNASSVDPDIIPAAILQGVDIVTDGGSSLYGADAVAGVMNFRTMKKFDGVKIDGNYGFGSTIKGYHAWDGAITAGHSWSTGNAYISVSHADRESVLNRQTPWANGTVYTATGKPVVTQTTCNAPQATVNRFIYLNIPGRFTGWTNNPLAGVGPVSLGTGCDQILDGTYLPSLKRSNVFASVSNAFSDTVDLRVTGYWMKRELGLPVYAAGTTSEAADIIAPVGAPGTAGAPASSPYDFPQGVGFALGPNSSYVNTPQKIGIRTWGISPELTVKLGSNWQVRTSMHFGRSDNSTHFPGLNPTATQCYITGTFGKIAAGLPNAGLPDSAPCAALGIVGGQLNPLNVAAANSAVIANITNWETAQDTTHQLFLARAIADGSIFTLPAGDAKLAVGAEYQNNKDATRIFTGKTGLLGTLPYSSVSRNVKSLFGELHVPVTSFADLAGSVRYDSYSDFGSTTNPNIGLTLKPASWLKVYGHWGTSYNAPTPYDNLGIGLGRAGQNYTPTVRPTIATGKTDNGQGAYFLVLTGGSPAGLKPQTSKNWAIGFDARLSSDFSVGGEFYSIDLKNAIGNLDPSNPSTYLTNPALYSYNNELTANGGALYNTIISQLANGAAINTQIGGAANVAILVDTRTSNLNAAKVEGVDFHINFDHNTSWGHLSAGINGTEKTRARISNSGAVTDELGHGAPRLTISTFVGMTLGGLSAKATFNYSGIYHDIGTDFLGANNDVNPFMVTNFAFGYDFKDSGSVLKGTSLRLNIDNAFNKQPQLVQRAKTDNPNFNNWTLGRVIKLGFTEKF